VFIMQPKIVGRNEQVKLFCRLREGRAVMRCARLGVYEWQCLMRWDDNTYSNGSTSAPHKYGIHCTYQRILRGSAEPREPPEPSLRLTGHLAKALFISTFLCKFLHKNTLVGKLLKGFLRLTLAGDSLDQRLVGIICCQDPLWWIVRRTR
jgi:hypothetical protein